MAGSSDVFQAMLLREFLLDEATTGEYDLSEVVRRLGVILDCSEEEAIGRFVAGDARSAVSGGLVHSAIVSMIQGKRSPLLVRLAAAVKKIMDAKLDDYPASCGFALGLAVRGEYELAFEALRRAGHVHDDWARHHHLYGLIHGARGDYSRALFELGLARDAEPFATTRGRIAEAIEEAQAGARAMDTAL